MVFAPTKIPSAIKRNLPFDDTFKTIEVEKNDYLKNRVKAVVLNPEEDREVTLMQQVKAVAQRGVEKSQSNKQKKNALKMKLKAKQAVQKEKKAKENRKRAFKEISKFQHSKAPNAKRHRSSVD